MLKKQFSLEETSADSHDGSAGRGIIGRDWWQTDDS